MRTGKKHAYLCQWKNGDVFAYLIESDFAKEKGLDGRYFLIQKVDDCVLHTGSVVPIVYVKITKDMELPTDIESYNQTEYVQTWFSKFEERFWPIDMSRPEEDIAEKSKICYQTDEYGFLPQYRAVIMNTSERVIPHKLMYIGNFIDALPPEKEFIPYSKMNIIKTMWESIGDNFETKMIKRYCGHNLRELSIYSNNHL